MPKFLIMVQAAQADYDAMAGSPTPGYPAWDRETLTAMVEHMDGINRELSEAGELVDARGLAEPARAVVVTAGPDGSPTVSDRPYGVDRPVLAGYWVIECAGPDRAVEIARRAYAAPVPEGSTPTDVVVRPIEDEPPGT